MKKTEYVTRRIVGDTIYNVYTIKNGELELLGREKTKGKLHRKDIAKKYNVDKVVMEPIHQEKKMYGVPVEEFMKIAVDLSDRLK